MSYPPPLKASTSTRKAATPNAIARLTNSRRGVSPRLLDRLGPPRRAGRAGGASGGSLKGIYTPSDAGRSSKVGGRLYIKTWGVAYTKFCRMTAFCEGHLDEKDGEV